MTTLIMMAIVPELFYTYGDKYLNFEFIPQEGTQLHFSSDNKTVDATIATLANFYVVDSDNSTTLGFQALLDLEADFNLQIGENNTIQFEFQNMTLTNLNVTIDNCGAKSDEQGIKTRLNGIILGVEAAVNAYISKLGLRLPQFQTFDYKVHFDYEQDAFGTGFTVIPKNSTELY